MAGGRGGRAQQWLLLLAAAVLLVGWWVVGGGPDADAPEPARPDTGTSETDPGTSETDPASGLPVVRLADLPPEAARTLELIDAGGPFPEERDGVTFENREELLPDQPRGYYSEYTVPTPGSDDRGARRIVAGEGGELYWTADHYTSFSRIVRTS
jgi:ribonuclease T1